MKTARLAALFLLLPFMALAVEFKVSSFANLKASLPCNAASCEFLLPAGTFVWEAPLLASSGSVTIAGSRSDPTVISCPASNGGLAILNITNGAIEAGTTVKLANLEVVRCNTSGLIEMQGESTLVMSNITFSSNYISDKAIHVKVPPMELGSYRVVMTNVTFRNNVAHNLLHLESSRKFNISNTFNTTIGRNNDSTLFVGDYEAFNPCEGPNCLPSVPGEGMYLLPRDPRPALSPFMFNETVVEADMQVLSAYLAPMQLNSVSFTNNTALHPHPLIFGSGVMFHARNFVMQANSIAWTVTNSTALYMNDTQAAVSSLLTLNVSHSNFTDLSMTQHDDISSGIWLEFPLGVTVFRRPVIANNTAVVSLFRFYGWTMYRDLKAYQRYIECRSIAFQMQDVGCSFRQGDILLSEHKDIQNEAVLQDAARDAGMKVDSCPTSGTCPPGVFDKARLYSVKFSRTLEWDSYLRHLNSRRSAALFFADGRVEGNKVLEGSVIHMAPYLNLAGWFNDKDMGVFIQWEGNVVRDNQIGVKWDTQKTAVVYTAHMRGVFRHSDFINNTGLSTLSMVHEVVVKAQDLVFIDNKNADITWWCAGAILNASDITFVRNQASQVYRSDDSDLGYHSIYMENNTGVWDPNVPHTRQQYNDSLFQTYKNKVYYFSNMTLVGNKAAGAVMGFRESDFLFNISDVKCFNNRASCLHLNIPLTSDRNFNDLCPDELYDITNSSFVNNIGPTGGALKVTADYRINIRVKKCNFTGNGALQGSLGGAIFAERDPTGSGRVTIEDCHFQDNWALEGGAVWVATNFTVVKSTFFHNRAGVRMVGAFHSNDAGAAPGSSGSGSGRTGGLAAASGTWGVAAAAAKSVTVAVHSTSGIGMVNASAVVGRGGGGAIFCRSCLLLNVTGNVFEANTAPSGGAIVAFPVTPVDAVVLSPGFWNNTFLGNNATGGDPSRDVYDESWEGCPLGGGGALCLKTSTNLSIMDNVFQGNEAVWGGALLTNTDYSGALLFGDDGRPLCLLNMTNNQFRLNVVRFGLAPVLFYNTSQGLCLHCDSSSPPVSTSNSTLAFLFGCEPPMWSQNTAVGKYPEPLPMMKGSGFHGMATFPYRVKLIASTIFEPSRSIVTSKEVVDYATGQCREQLFNFASEEAPTAVSSIVEVSSHAMSANSSQKAVVKSGGHFSMTARLYDRHQLLVPRALNNISLIIDAPPSLVVYNWRTFIPYNWSSTWINITLQPANLSVRTKANVDFFNQDYNLNIVPISSQQYLETQVMDLSVRRCFIGEYMSDAGTCSLCQPGSFSLIPDMPCNPCPVEGVCEDKVHNPAQGLGFMVPRDRFWKSSVYSPALHRCPLSGACRYPRVHSNERSGRTSRVRVLQSILFNKQEAPEDGCTSKMFMMAQCMTGYEGNLCGLCSRGYGRQSTSCMRCYSRFANSMLIILLLIIISAVLAALVASHIRSVGPGESISGPNPPGLKPQDYKETLVRMFKVVLSFVQVLGITRTAQIQWPNSLGFFTRFVDPTSSFALVSPDCSLPRTDGPQTVAVKRTLFFTLLPAGYIFVSALGWKIWAWIRKSHRLNADYAWPYFVLSVQQICYLLYPITTSSLLSIFTCWQLDDLHDKMTNLYANTWAKSNNGTIITTGHFWSENLSQRCYQGGHLLLVLVYGVPAIIMFSVGVPFVFLTRLYKHRRRLTDPYIMLKYGFLFEEYRKDYYFWEVVIMVRKALLLMVTILLAPMGSATQLHAAIFVQMCSTLLHELAHPYTDQRLNNMERVSLYSNQLTLLGLSVLAISQEDRQVVLAMTTLLFVLNCSVLVYFLVIIAKVARDWVLLGHFKMEIRNLMKIISLKDSGTVDVDEDMRSKSGDIGAKVDWARRDTGQFSWWRRSRKDMRPSFQLDEDGEAGAANSIRDTDSHQLKRIGQVDDGSGLVHFSPPDKSASVVL